MSDLKDKVASSIERLKAFEPEEGYYLAFSGGKDSVVCKVLLEMSGCKYDATYRVTSVDPPELVRFIKEQHPDVKREVPRYPVDYKNPKLAGKPVSMWNLIPEKHVPPTRVARYCCEALKESGGDGRMTVTGVRWAESKNRRDNQGIVTIFSKKAVEETGVDSFFFNKAGGVVLTNDNSESRRMVEQCYKRHKTTVNPIIEWEDRDVWDFIKANEIPYCSLYDEGFNRLGCIGCPMAGKYDRVNGLARYPKYKNAYLLSFAKMLEERKKINLPSNRRWEGATPRDVMNWWLDNGVLKGQINLFEDEIEEEDE